MVTLASLRGRTRCSRPELGCVDLLSRTRRRDSLHFLHHVNEASLRKAYLGLKRHAAPGEDGVTWEDYGKNLKSHLNYVTEPADQWGG